MAVNRVLLCECDAKSFKDKLEKWWEEVADASQWSG
jgi:hypothetical protein